MRYKFNNLTYSISMFIACIKLKPLFVLLFPMQIDRTIVYVFSYSVCNLLFLIAKLNAHYVTEE